MRRGGGALLLLLTVMLELLWLSEPAWGQTVSSAVEAGLAEKAQRWANEMEFSGSLELRRGQQTLARIERGAGARPSTESEPIFWIGSVSKQFAAVLTLQLAEQGLLRLQAPVTELVPGLSPDALVKDGVRCTVEHLLSHTCGLPRDSDSDYLHTANHLTDPARARRLLDQLEGATLRFVPGSEYHYSNVGYDLVGLLLQTVAGQPYELLLQRQLWAPLGMSSTGIALRPGVEPVRGETGLGPLWLDAARWLLLDVTTPGTFGASGNVYSSVSDLLRWNDALHHGRLLSASSYANFVAPRHGKYGLGVAISDKPFGTSLNHLGSHAPHSSSALVVYVPGRDLSLAAVANRTAEASGLGKLAEALLTEASGMTAAAPRALGLSEQLLQSVPLLTLALIVFVALSVLRRCFDRKATWDMLRWWLQYHAAVLGLAAISLRWRPDPLDPLLLLWGALAVAGAWSGRYWTLPRWRSGGSWRRALDLAGYAALLVLVLSFSPQRIAWLAGVLVLIELLPVAALVARGWAVRRGAAATGS